MNTIAPVAVPIRDTLRRRYSPYSYDPDRDVSQEDLRALFEAARWTMSSSNGQPWRYIVGVRGRSDAVREKILDSLAKGNQPWATHVPVLAVGLAKHHFDDSGDQNKAAVHDLGAASAFLTVEATSRGLQVHQMIGIEPDKVCERFDIPDGVEPFTALAIGYAGEPHPSLDDKYVQRDEKPRQRKSLDELILHGAI